MLRNIWVWQARRGGFLSRNPQSIVPTRGDHEPFVSVVGSLSEDPNREPLWIMRTLEDLRFPYLIEPGAIRKLPLDDHQALRLANRVGAFRRLIAE